MRTCDQRNRPAVAYLHVRIVLVRGFRCKREPSLIYRQGLATLYAALQHTSIVSQSVHRRSIRRSESLGRTSIVVPVSGSREAPPGEGLTVALDVEGAIPGGTGVDGMAGVDAPKGDVAGSSLMERTY